MTAEIIGVVSFIGASGIIATRVWKARSRRKLVASRLARWADSGPVFDSPLNLLKQKSLSEGVRQQLRNVTPHVDLVHALLVQSGHDGKLTAFLVLTSALLIAPPLAAFALGFDLVLSLVLGAFLSAVPFIFLKLMAEARRNRFSEQLPDAIDLMVSVLKSGHSVPSAVKAVAEEIAAPCGPEFEIILKRMNLGQPLAQAINYSAGRFRSYELDLMRRAVAIQFEVGGSLGELLDKTNSTLRQRLKLVRQVRVITAQSRLTAMIVGFMPFALAIGLNILSPGYLQPLLEDGPGRLMLCLAIVLQVIGLFVLKRMSAMRV